MVEPIDPYGILTLLIQYAPIVMAMFVAGACTIVTGYACLCWAMERTEHKRQIDQLKEENAELHNALHEFYVAWAFCDEIDANHPAIDLAVEMMSRQAADG